AGMLSPSGESRAFCRGAEGFVRGEGCGLVLLKRLSAALEGGDRVLAVLRGTAVNQDGRSNGLTAPNGPAQQAVIRQALAASGLEPDAIDYLEAHGTGTELGDPTEWGALAGVFGQRSPETPLRVGAAKANLGHLEGAAGVAGLIKVVLALHHQQLPPHPLLDPTSDGPYGPSPHIDWSAPLEVPTELTDWQRSEGRVRRAGVSSFGFGGTNAHAILEEAPAEALVNEPPSIDGPRWLTLSARSEPSLKQLAERYADWLEAETDTSLEAACFAANTGRAALAERLAVKAGSREELIERLRWQPEHATRRGTLPAGATPPGVGWLFGGQGGVWAGMGRGLAERYPAFAQEWNACDEIVQAHWPRGLEAIAWGDEAENHLAEVDAQPALVAYQLALAALWRSWAGPPAWVLGHSLGELAAAVTAGMLTRDEAIALVCRRAELLGKLTNRGGMLAVHAAGDEVAEVLPSELAIAAHNGPRQTVVAGDEAALDAFASNHSSWRPKRLATTHAFHSPLVEPVLDDYRQAAVGVPLRAPTCGFVSTLTGEPLRGPLPAGYWADQMRQPVRFAEAIAAATDGDQAKLLEVSPRPVLRSFASPPVLPAAGWRDGEEATAAEEAAASLWAAGVRIDYRSIHPPQRLACSPPTYPFQRTRHWFKAGTRRIAAPKLDLLGERLDLAGEAIVFQTDLAEHAWLEDHKLRGKPTLPAMATCELAWLAARQVTGEDGWTIEGLKLLRPVTWEGPGARGQGPGQGDASNPQSEIRNPQSVQLWLTPDGERFTFALQQRTASGWREAATGRLAPAAEAEPALAFEEDSLNAIDPAEHYRRCAAAGLDYGPAFQAITRLAGKPGVAAATLRRTTEAPADALAAIADAALQATAAALPNDNLHAIVPQAIAAAQVLRSPIGEDSFSAFVTQNETDDAKRRVATVELRTAGGELVVRLDGVELVAMPRPAAAGKVVTPSSEAVQEATAEANLAQLADVSLDEKHAIVLDHVRRRLAVVMDMTVEQLDPEQALDTLGLDSLMALELRDDLEESLGVEPPMDLFLQRMTLRDLAAEVVELIGAAPAAGSEGAGNEDMIEGVL
ncbi:MAG: acyltransferase domain-containing protein, partial [Planctomycetota bacterium]